MPLPIEQIKTIRRWLGWIFVASLLVTFLVGFIAAWRNPWHGILRSEEMVVFASLVTSVTTFLGFLVTTGMTWRKERRETDHASVELEKTNLSLRSSAARLATKTSQRKPKGIKRVSGGVSVKPHYPTSFNVSVFF